METGSDLVIERPDVSAAPERVGFFEHEGLHLAATTHSPPGAVAGVVICPSLFTEALRNYRREVLVARALAARGVAAQRFHYRGTGNSDDLEGMTFATLCSDARFAADLLAASTGITRQALLGTRFGALVAAATARHDPTAPVVLIEPVLEARRFFREGLRAKAMSGFKSVGGASTVAGLTAELEQRGSVDVLGDELEWSLFRSAADVTLAEQLGSAPRPILLVQLGADEPFRADYEALADVWRAAGSDVELAAVGERSAWWFMDERDPVGAGALRSTGLADADELVLLVVTWLSNQLEGSEG